MADRHEGVSVMIREEQPPPVDVCNNRFPYSIVWGPLPPCTCCCPVVGHMGIGDSQGRIHDFAGPYCIGVDDFMVSCVWRYAVVSGPEDPNWDAAIEQADRKYRGRVHDIVCDNCHHHNGLHLPLTQTRPHHGSPQPGAATPPQSSTPSTTTTTGEAPRQRPSVMRRWPASTLSSRLQSGGG